MNSEIKEYPTNEARIEVLESIKDFLVKYHQKVWFTVVGGLREEPDFNYIAECHELFPTGVSWEKPSGGQFEEIDFLYAEHHFREMA